MSKTIVYPNASHQFLIKKQTRINNIPSFGNCDLGIRDDGEMHYPRLGISVNGDWRGFVRKVFKDCGKKGFLQGGSPESHNSFISDIKTFFINTLK